MIAILLKAVRLTIRRGSVMDKLYFGIGIALYVLFAAWCMITPQK
jgi:hypothetical protein